MKREKMNEAMLLIINAILNHLPDIQLVCVNIQIKNRIEMEIKQNGIEYVLDWRQLCKIC